MQTDASDLYRDIILELYHHPLNKKILNDFDIEHRELNASCGDDITVRIKFVDDKVVDVGYQGVGCAISQAAASLITDHIQDKTRIEIENMSEKDINELLGFEVVYTRKKCAELGLTAIKKAMELNKIKQN